MSTNSKRKAIIVGGSLGGLFAATTLRAIGWDVEVFERSPSELYSRGGGLVLQPDVLNAFHFAGIQHPSPLGVRSGDRIFLDEGDHVIHRQYMPQTQTSWQMLYGILKRAVPAELAHAGEQFVGFEQRPDGVEVRFASGRTAFGELMIGADGARSSVREHLLPKVTPRYAGYVAWRGLVDEPDLTARIDEVLGQTFAWQRGRDHLLLEYLVPGLDGSIKPGSRRRNWVWYRAVREGQALQRVLTDRDGVRHTFSLPPGTPDEAVIAEMRDAAGKLLAPTFQHLVAATKEPFLQAILDLQVPQMVFGRALLLGDAAFVPRPHTAGGAAKAAANAVALAQSLQGSPNSIELALRHWEASQIEEGRSMCEWGISIGDELMGIDTAANDADGSSGPQSKSNARVANDR